MQVIGYGLPDTGLDRPAEVVQFALPVTPAVATVSEFLSPSS